MDQVRKLDRVLDEEHRDVVSHQIPVPGVGVELHGEPTSVAGEVGGALVAGDGRETGEHLGALPRFAEQDRGREVGLVLVALEVPSRAVAASVDDAFGDSLVVEVEDLLAELEVLQQYGPRAPDGQRVLVVGDRDALRRGQCRDVVASALMRGRVRLLAGW